MDSSENITVESKGLGHLGIVIGIIEKLNLKNRIDRLIPKKGDHYITHGDAIVAMILNGLGFKERRLYLMTQFLESKAFNRLFGEKSSPNYYNDDVLGRALDAIYKYGVNKFFIDLAIPIVHKLQKFSPYIYTEFTCSDFKKLDLPNLK